MKCNFLKNFLAILNNLKLHIWHAGIEVFEIFASLHETPATCFEWNTEYILRKEMASES